MTRDRLQELNDMVHNMDALQRILNDIPMLLSNNSKSVLYIRGSDFRNSNIPWNICDKLQPIIEEELERLNSEFADG